MLTKRDKRKRLRKAHMRSIDAESNAKMKKEQIIENHFALDKPIVYKGKSYKIIGKSKIKQTVILKGDDGAVIPDVSYNKIII